MEWLHSRVCGARPRARDAEAPPAAAGPLLETERERRERWRSVYVIYFTMFQMSLGFSIVLTGVWPYLDKLSPGSQKEVLGLAVGANPLGQLLFSPLLGLWANRAGSARAPLLATLALFVAASVLYAHLHLTRPHAHYWMVFARFLVGVASANIAVARSYLSAATLVAERTRCVAWVSLAQVLGFVVGPALQAAAAPLGPGAPYPAPGAPGPALRLDMYTAAGWINALLGALNLLLFLPCCFKERKIAAREAMIAQGKGSEKEVLKSMKPDLVSSWTLIAAFFVLVFNFVLLETLATSLTMDQFAWSKRQALEYMGALMSGGAVLACLTFAAIGPLTKLFEERALLLWGGFLLTGLASVLCIPWGPGAPPAAPAGAAEAGGGCPAAAQPWCLTTRQLTLPQFLLGYACISVGYSLGVTLIQTIFSKVLGPRPQGVWMGLLTGAGCLSRALGPVFVATVYARRGPPATFGSTAALTFAALCALRVVYGRLQPPPAPAAERELLSLRGHKPPDDAAPQELLPLRSHKPPDDAAPQELLPLRGHKPPDDAAPQELLPLRGHKPPDDTAPQELLPLRGHKPPDDTAPQELLPLRGHKPPDDTAPQELLPLRGHKPPDDAAPQELLPLRGHKPPDDAAPQELLPLRSHKPPDDAAPQELLPLRSHKPPDDAAPQELLPLRGHKAPDDAALQELLPLRSHKPPDDAAPQELLPLRGHKAPDDAAPHATDGDT